ncbi:MAG: hypothetical protein MI864_10905 [Pseudomonadales bacterium]|uniref:PEP-CTERM sorting domain-containing protein n=1 Tax=Oleiphilus messinensis TaxID=141451 RepID=A0A1Y0ICQ8_9GAMM|nr:hypothetical protein [Oleiphilus messinensis]ARU58040.1 hypothetical protein OLMES_4022 [Oleiphilus messinensis]MCG8611033.1 hypothetical protein [Pseudomonadales bacterium]
MYKFLSILALLSLSAATAAIPLDFNDFYVEGDVTVSADGSRAEFYEDGWDFQRLSNDPFLGDPEVILTGEFNVLRFDYSFNEPQDVQFNNDAMVVTIFDWFSQDPYQGQWLAQWVVDESRSGTFSASLANYFSAAIPSVGLLIDLESRIGGGDAGLDSTLVVENLRLDIVDPSQVPVPSTVFLLLIACIGLRNRIHP